MTDDGKTVMVFTVTYTDGSTQVIESAMPSIWDGSSETAKEDLEKNEEGAFVVDTPAEFVGALNNITDEENTIDLAGDIYLNNAEWTPIVVSAYADSNSLIINGNGNTIYGLTDMLVSGAAQGVPSVEIYDLTIADSNIQNDVDDVTVGGKGVGAFIGHPDGGVSKVVLSNCHLVNSTVNGGHWTGGLIGYAAGYSDVTNGACFLDITITDCSVKDSTITGKGSCGAIIGHATGSSWTKVTIENCEVSGNTVTSTGTADNKAGSLIGTIGAAGLTDNGKTGGTYVNNTVVENNAVTSNGVVNTKIYGRQGTSTGRLFVDGEEIVLSTTVLKDVISGAAGEEVEITLAAGTYDIPSAKNVDLTVKGTKDTVINNVKNDNGIFTNATFEGVTIKGNTSGQYNGFSHTNHIVYKNCTIEGTITLYGQSETFENCTFNLPKGCYVWTWGAKNVTFKNCTFNTAGKAILMYGENCDTVMNVTGCKFYASAGDKAGAVANQNCAAIEIDNSGKGNGTAQCNYTLTTSNNTVETTEGKFSGEWRIKTNADTHDIVVNGVEYDGVVVLDGVHFIFSDAMLETALKCDQENIVVELTADASLNVSDAYIKLGGEDTKSITINGNGNTLTLATTYWSRLNLVNSEAKLVINNATVTSSQVEGTWNSYDVTFNCNVELTNVVFEKAVALDGEGTTALLKNVKISETNDYYALWISAQGQTVTMEDCEIDSLGRGIKIDEQYVGTPAKVTLNVKNCKFTTKSKSAIIVKSSAGAEINVSDVDITNVAADSVNAVWVDEDGAAYADLVIVTGATKVIEGQQ